MSSTANTSTIAAIESKKPTTKQELIAANIKLLIEQLEAGESDAPTNYLTAMSRFHNYSFGNVLEIARQMPTATRVAGFWTWKNLGRSVKAGQKGKQAADEKAKQAATRRRIILIIVAGVVLIAAAVLIWKIFFAAPPIPASIVVVSGRIEGDDSAVASKTTGRILEVREREGGCGRWPRHGA